MCSLMSISARFSSAGFSWDSEEAAESVRSRLIARLPGDPWALGGRQRGRGKHLCCFGDYSGQYEHQIPRSAWKTMVADIMDRHRDQVIVSVKCHIY